MKNKIDTKRLIIKNPSRISNKVNETIDLVLKQELTTDEIKYVVMHLMAFAQSMDKIEEVEDCYVKAAFNPIYEDKENGQSN